MTLPDHGFRIENLADHLDLVDTIAQWHWDEWGHLVTTGSAESWAEALRTRTNRSRIPATFVALQSTSGEPLGSVSLVDNDMESHPELAPWLAGVYTHPNHRKQGVASALVHHAVQAAAHWGVSLLYLHTETARDLYASLGWQPITVEPFEGMESTIMSIDCQKVRD